MESNYAHEAANEIGYGLDRSKATAKGKKALVTLEKESENDTEKQREMAKFALLMALLIKKSGLTKEQIKQCQQVIIQQFYMNECSLEDRVVDSIILQMHIHLGVKK